MNDPLRHVFFLLYFESGGQQWNECKGIAYQSINKVGQGFYLHTLRLSREREKEPLFFLWSQVLVCCLTIDLLAILAWHQPRPQQRGHKGHNKCRQIAFLGRKIHSHPFSFIHPFNSTQFQTILHKVRGTKCKYTQFAIVNKETRKGCFCNLKFNFQEKSVAYFEMHRFYVEQPRKNQCSLLVEQSFNVCPGFFSGINHHPPFFLAFFVLPLLYIVHVCVVNPPLVTEFLLSSPFTHITTRECTEYDLIDSRAMLSQPFPHCCGNPRHNITAEWFVHIYPRRLRTKTTQALHVYNV